MNHVQRTVFGLSKSLCLGQYEADFEVTKAPDRALAVDRVLINVSWPQFLFVRSLRIDRTTIDLGGVDAVNLTLLVDDILRGQSIPARKGEPCIAHVAYYSGIIPPGLMAGCPFGLILSLMGPAVDAKGL